MTQIDFIMDKLKQDGEISRNYCLRNYISRLGARINDLKKIGFEFETENRDGDYVYKLVKKDTLF